MLSIVQSFRNLDLDHRINLQIDKLLWNFVFLLPKWLAYRCFIRVATYNEMGNPYETKCGVALERFLKK